MRALSSF